MDNSGDKDQWVLTPAERSLVMAKNRANRLGFAILLTFFRERGRFPRDESEIETQGVALLSQQLEVPIPIDGEAIPTGRTAERLRAEIRVRFGFREVTVADGEMLTAWLRDHVAGEVGGDIDPMVARLEARCKELSIEPPTPDRIVLHVVRCMRTKTCSTMQSMNVFRPNTAGIWMPCYGLRNSVARIVSKMTLPAARQPSY